MAERTARFSNWFQIISNVAIIFGLGLVVYELNQSKQLAFVQFINEDFARLTGLQVAMMGEDPREALAKVALHPSDLNERDAVALDALYNSIVMSWNNLAISSRIGGLDRPWRLVVAQQSRKYFSSDPGRRWLRAWAARLDDSFGNMGLAEIATAAVESDSDNYYRSQYELLLNRN